MGGEVRALVDPCYIAASRMEVTPEEIVPNRRLRVFLCHSSGDKPAVRDLYRRLRPTDSRPGSMKKNYCQARIGSRRFRRPYGPVML